MTYPEKIRAALARRLAAHGLTLETKINDLPVAYRPVYRDVVASFLLDHPSLSAD